MSETDRIPSTVRLNGPDELVLELPGLLGYHPEESLVAVLAQGQALRCVLRLDLAEFGPELTERLVRIAGRAEADTAFIALYTEDDADGLPFAAEVDELCRELSKSEVHLADALLVGAGRYWSYLCEDPRCCPPEGREVPQGTPVLEAERVRSGRPRVAETRSQAASAYRLRLDLHPSAEALRAAHTLLGRPAQTRGRIVVEAVSSLTKLLEGGRLGLDPIDDELEDSLRAVVMVLVQDIHVRDFLLGSLSAGAEDLDTDIEVMIRTAVSAPEYLRPPVAATAAALLAADGSNPVALWAMVGLSEDESLSGLVRSSVEQGYPPDLVREVFAEALPLVEERLTTT